MCAGKPYSFFSPQVFEQPPKDAYECEQRMCHLANTLIILNVFRWFYVLLASVAKRIKIQK
jgi:hypothetical protein